MSQTNIRGSQILNATVQRQDLDTTTVGQALVTKIVQGTNVTLSSSGADSGTGDVTVSAQSAFVTKTSAYTLTTADSSNYIICSGGSFTLTLPAPAAGLNYRVRNDMGISGTTGTITLSPTSGTVDGLASILLLPQQECRLITDGTNWRTFGKQREVVLGTLDITSATASATVLLPVGYRIFLLDFAAFLTSVDNVSLYGVFSIDGGSTFISSAYYSQFVYNNAATTVAGFASANTAQATLATVGTTPGTEIQLKIYPGSSLQRTSWQSQFNCYLGGSAFQQIGVAGGFLGSNQLVNAFKYSLSSGNITNSFLTVKGVV